MQSIQTRFFFLVMKQSTDSRFKTLYVPTLFKPNKHTTTAKTYFNLIFQDNDDKEHLIKTSKELREGISNPHLEDGTVDSIERCPSEEQLDTQVVNPSSRDPRTHYFTVEPIFFLIFAAGTIAGRG